ncbi:MAG: hypothetical protein V8S99_08525 [Oscillospiraceae bacterium]
MQTERPSAVYVYPPDDSFFTGHEIPFSWAELKRKIRYSTITPVWPSATEQAHFALYR